MRSTNTYILATIAVLITAVVGGTGYVLGIHSRLSEKTIQEIAEITTPRTTWEKPLSSKQGYPRIDPVSSQLSIFSIADQQTTPTTHTVYNFGGSVGIGSSDPKPSPDLLLTAFIDNKTRSLHILSNQTYLSAPIPQSMGVSMISGWSPDNKHLIYYREPKTISLPEGQGYFGGPTQSTHSFLPGADSGFFLFNLETGITTKLHPVEYFLSFVDKDRILVRSDHQSPQLVLFNIRTFEADYMTVNEEFDSYLTGQYSITQDGRSWAYNLSTQANVDSRLILAPFPQKKGIEIDAGAWAFVQFPVISPKGTKVAYQQLEEPESNIFGVWVYNTVDGSKHRYGTGFRLVWVDESRLLIHGSNNSLSLVNTDIPPADTL